MRIHSFLFCQDAHSISRVQNLFTGHTRFLLCFQLSHKFPLVSKRTFAGNQFEIFMKAREIIKTAFIAKLFDAEIIFNQQFAGMAHAYLN